jgi:hypothetical protein
MTWWMVSVMANAVVLATGASSSARTRSSPRSGGTQALELGADAYVEKATTSSTVATLLGELCGAGAVTRISHAPAARVEMLIR